MIWSFQWTISKPYPRKGTETTWNVFPFMEFAAIISKPYPRKGTETIGFLYLRNSSLEFQNHIPARGRKQILCILVTASPSEGFQNHIPARGRKLCLFKEGVKFRVQHFKTISPQGDGNSRISSATVNSNTISKPYPRKGTETHWENLPS